SAPIAPAGDASKGLQSATPLRRRPGQQLPTPAQPGRTVKGDEGAVWDLGNRLLIGALPLPHTLRATPLHRWQIQRWGACTLSEYQTTIERDAPMQRCFEVVRLPSSPVS